MTEKEKSGDFYNALFTAAIVGVEVTTSVPFLDPITLHYYIEGPVNNVLWPPVTLKHTVRLAEEGLNNTGRLLSVYMSLDIKSVCPTRRHMKHDRKTAQHVL